MGRSASICTGIPHRKHLVPLYLKADYPKRKDITRALRLMTSAVDATRTSWSFGLEMRTSPFLMENCKSLFPAKRAAGVRWLNA